MAGGSDALFLAGGQSLVPAMNFRLARPAMLIDINPLHELDYVRAAGDGGLRIGALARHRTLERDALVAQHAPLRGGGGPARGAPPDPQPGHARRKPRARRSRLGAAGGDARARCTLSRAVVARRALDRASAFFRGPLTTALGPEEMLVEIALPVLPSRSGTCFVEVARRRGDYALLGVAAVVTLGSDGVCTAAGLALCNAGPTPVRATKAAAALVGRRVGEREIREAAAAAAGEIDPPGNVHATAAFRRHLAGVLTRRALETAVARAERR